MTQFGRHKTHTYTCELIPCMYSCHPYGTHTQWVPPLKHTHASALCIRSIVEVCPFIAFAKAKWDNEIAGHILAFYGLTCVSLGCQPVCLLVAYRCTVTRCSSGRFRLVAWFMAFTKYNTHTHTHTLTHIHSCNIIKAGQYVAGITTKINCNKIGEVPVQLTRLFFNFGDKFNPLPPAAQHLTAERWALRSESAAAPRQQRSDKIQDKTTPAHLKHLQKWKNSQEINCKSECECWNGWWRVYASIRTHTHTHTNIGAGNKQ